MSSEKKVKFIKSEDNDTIKTVTYASYLKTDYVERSIVIMLNKENIIIEIFFNSNAYGSVHWENGVGLRDCHKWETEEEAKSTSALARRYTALLSDGMENLEYAETKIITDIISNMENQTVANFLAEVIKAKEYANPVKIKDE